MERLVRDRHDVAGKAVALPAVDRHFSTVLGVARLPGQGLRDAVILLDGEFDHFLGARIAGRNRARGQQAGDADKRVQVSSCSQGFLPWPWDFVSRALLFVRKGSGRKRFHPSTRYPIMIFPQSYS